nr:TonB family protein [Luteimonas sp. BDR2-5]
MTIDDWPKRARGREVNAYVVISYNLDGSGKAKDLVVTDSKPKGLFDKTTLSILERTEFATGIQASSCVYVRTYGSVNRAER